MTRRALGARAAQAGATITGITGAHRMGAGGLQVRETPADVAGRPAGAAPIRVVDFFAGCGGTSAGLRLAGHEIVLGLDSDPEVQRTFEANFPQATFLCRDIGKVRTRALEATIAPFSREPWLFSACAPCQPFSQHRRPNPNDTRADLLSQFVRFLTFYRPDFVLVENVPGLQSMATTYGPFTNFVARLARLGYQIAVGVVDACDYGVPQRRRRLVVLASRHGAIGLPPATHGPAADVPFSTVRDWIGQFPPIAAGETHTEVPNHRAMNLSPTNLARIQATVEGGRHTDWPAELQLACHKGFRGRSDVYGRMRWDALASALTTRCISLSNGRFGHPDQDRAISVREAATLQTFPLDFTFSGTLTAMSRHIGNAVPVLMAQRIGEHVSAHAVACGLHVRRAEVA